MKLIGVAKSVMFFALFITLNQQAAQLTITTTAQSSTLKKLQNTIAKHQTKILAAGALLGIAYVAAPKLSYYWKHIQDAQQTITHRELRATQAAQQTAEDRTERGKLFIAIKGAQQTGDKEKIKQLLTPFLHQTIDGSPALDVQENNDDGFRPLHHAINARNVPLAEWLLDQKANIELPTKLLETPLMFELSISARAGAKIEHMTNLLVRRGANLNAGPMCAGDRRNAFWTVLSKSYPSTEYVKLVLAAGGEYEAYLNKLKRMMADAPLTDNPEVNKLLENPAAFIQSAPAQAIRERLSINQA